MLEKIRCATTALLATTLFILTGCSSINKTSANLANPDTYLSDVHFHPSNYAFQGVPLRKFIEEYQTTERSNIVRSVLMPLPLQQRWDSFEKYQASEGEFLYGPNYYIDPKADLYYYSFADAMYAKEYLELPSFYRSKLDLMITGFNPMDVYASQHIKRAVLTYPGAFAGIGEFTIHKEVVSNKIAGDTVAHTAGEYGRPSDVYAKDGKVTLYADSLTRILNTAAEVGLVAMLHNDLYFVEVDHTGKNPKLHPDKSYAKGLEDLCKRAPDAKVIWAHTGLGRFVKPQANHLEVVSGVLDACKNWRVDISWDLVQDYILTPKPGMPSKEKWEEFLVKYKTRVLWGSDTVIFSRNIIDTSKEPATVAPGTLMSPDKYHEVAEKMQEFLAPLKENAGHFIRYENYSALFDEAKSKVRNWETLHKNDNIWDIPTRLQ